jgi:hypothetical protein
MPGGYAERGTYLHGVRVGIWIRMTWGMGEPSYEEPTYALGKVVATRTLVNAGPAADQCRRSCADDERSCEAAQRACPPGMPCLVRACDEERASCDLECNVVRVAPWEAQPHAAARRIP